MGTEQEHMMSRSLGNIEGSLEGIRRSVDALRVELKEDIMQNRENLQAQINELRSASKEKDKHLANLSKRLNALPSQLELLRRQQRGHLVQVLIAIATTAASIIAVLKYL